MSCYVLNKGLQKLWITENISYWYFPQLYRFLWTHWNYICGDRIMPEPAPSGHYIIPLGFFFSGHASWVNVWLDLYFIWYQDLYLCSMLRIWCFLGSSRFSAKQLKHYIKHEETVEKQHHVHAHEWILNYVLPAYVQNAGIQFPQQLSNFTLIRDWLNKDNTYVHKNNNL